MPVGGYGYFSNILFHNYFLHRWGGGGGGSIRIGHLFKRVFAFVGHDGGGGGYGLR